MTPAEEHDAEGLNFRYYRVKKGLMQKEVAEKAKKSRSFVNEVECGKNVNRSSMISLCNAIGVPRWVVAKIKDNWRKRLPLIMKMEKRLQEKKRAERKTKGLRG